MAEDMPSSVPQRERQDIVGIAEDVKKGADNLCGEIVSLIEENRWLRKKMQSDEDVKVFHKREIEMIKKCIDELQSAVAAAPTSTEAPQKVSAQARELNIRIERATLSSRKVDSPEADMPFATAKRSVQENTEPMYLHKSHRRKEEPMHLNISLVMTYSFPSPVSSTAVSRDGSFVAAGCEGACYVLSKRSPKFLWLIHSPAEKVIEETYIPNFEIKEHCGEAAQGDGHVRGMSFSPSGHLLITTMMDKRIRAWDVDAKTLLYVAALEDDVYRLTCNDRHIYACCSNGVFHILDLHTGELLERVAPDKGKERIFISIALTPDNRYLFMGTADACIVAYDLEKRQKAGEWKDHQKSVYCLDINPEGKLLVSGSLDTSFIVYKIGSRSTGLELSRFYGPFCHEQFVLCAGFTKDSRYLLTGSRDATIQAWSLCDEQEAGKSLVLNAHEDSVLSISTHQEGYFVSGGGDKKLKIFSLEEDEERSSEENSG